MSDAILALGASEVAAESFIRAWTVLDAIDITTGLPLQRAHAAGRPSDIRHIVPDNAAARGAFAWQPRIPLDEGLERTWRWFTTRH